MLHGMQNNLSVEQVHKNGEKLLRGLRFPIAL